VTPLRTNDLTEVGGNVAYQALGERVGVVPGGVNVGVVRGTSGAAIMIDTGINETNGKKALKSIREALGADVQAIITTHGHADHFGANAAVVSRTNATVYAPTIDEVFLRYPLMQPSLLFGGGDPMDGLRTSFLLARPSPVDQVYDTGTLTIDGVEFEVLDLGGHSPGQKGLVADGVFFCADVVLPESVLAKYRIPYLYSVSDHVKALELAAGTACDIAVAGHGALLDDLPAACASNRELVEQVSAAIVDLLTEPMTAENLLTAIFNRFDAPITDAAGYFLLQPTIYAFLSDLERRGAVNHAIEDRRSLWRRS
jgi:glyoxylase-like metal-dependent hydrolase (beta-lactamase superfamily II)